MVEYILLFAVAAVMIFALFSLAPVPTTTMLFALLAVVLIIVALTLVFWWARRGQEETE